MLASSWLSVQLLRSSRIGYSVLTDVQIRPTPSCAVSVWRYKPPPSSFMISADRWVNVPPPKQSNVVTSKSVRIIQCQGGGGVHCRLNARGHQRFDVLKYTFERFLPQDSVPLWLSRHDVNITRFKVIISDFFGHLIEFQDTSSTIQISLNPSMLYVCSLCM